MSRFKSLKTFTQKYIGTPSHFQRKTYGGFLFCAVLVVILLSLSLYYYLSDDSASISDSSHLSEVMANVTPTSGIGGGSIIGNSKAGNKDLPIYCVDIASKIKQGTAGSDASKNQESISDSNSNENTSTSDSEPNKNPSTDFQSDKKYVSLSFDAAWGDEDTIQILDILDKYNVKVTFFMTGGWVESYPDKVKEIYARGHDLGNHSQNHKQMSKLDVAGQKEELLSVGTKVKELTGYDMFLFRPPYGDYNSTLITTAYGCNYYPIQWSVDSLDWKDYGVDKIVERVTKNKSLDNGAIILMHNGAKFTADALESVITSLQEQGYTLVPISQLIIKENFHMDGTGKQIAD